MTITVRIDNVPGVLTMLGRVPVAVREYIKRTFSAIGIGLEAYIKNNKLHGQVLHHRSGKLEDSIHAEDVRDNGGLITVAVGTNRIYARIHEYGGTTKPHDIVAKRAEALHFVMGGKEFFRRRVHHPGSRMPMRSFLRSSMREYYPEAVRMIEAGVKRAVDGAKQ